MRGRLLTADFLEVGIRRTAEYQAVGPEAVAVAAVRLRAIVESLLVHLEPNESTTEREVVEPVLEVLGWRQRLPQPSLLSAYTHKLPDHTKADSPQILPRRIRQIARLAQRAWGRR